MKQRLAWSAYVMMVVALCGVSARVALADHQFARCSGGCCKLAATAVACVDTNCTCQHITAMICGAGLPDECEQ